MKRFKLRYLIIAGLAAYLYKLCLQEELLGYCAGGYTKSKYCCKFSGRPGAISRRLCHPGW